MPLREHLERMPRGLLHDSANGRDVFGRHSLLEQVASGTRWPLALTEAGRYATGMKSNTKSSITLPAEEIRLVRSLKAKLKVRTNVEVVRRGLRLLQATTDRAELQEAYRRASKAVRTATRKEIAELDRLSGEGLD